MKKIITLLAVFIAANAALAQTSNLIVFHEDGEEFTMYLNEVKKNDSPSPLVKVTGLSSGVYKMRIEFKTQSLKDIKKPLWLEQKGTKYTYKIAQKNNEEYVISSVGEEPLESSEIQEEDEVAKETGNVQDSVNIQMEIGETGTDISMTHGEQTTNFNMNVNVEESSHEQEELTETTQPEEDDSQNSSGNCAYPMSTIDFRDAKSSIESKDFENSKFSMAKRTAKNECLETSQVKEIIQVFDYEDTRLKFAKYAYDYVHNPKKYYKVNDAFEYEMTMEELNEYIDSKE